MGATPAYTDIAYDVADGVATISLNRPDQLNTFTGAMGRELSDAYRLADGDPDVRCVVVTGTGRAFCAGANLSGGESFTKPDEASRTGKAPFSSNPLTFNPYDVRKPVIAAVNGHAIGVGLSMTMAADIRIFARDAKYGFVHVRRGVMPDVAAHWTVPRIIGHARTAELFLTGRMFDGTEAERLGLANEVLDGADVLARALEIATEIARHTAPVSVAVTKRLLWTSPDLSHDEVVAQETADHIAIMSGPDAREGAMAFMERRDPDWSMTLEEHYPPMVDPSEPLG